MSRRWHWGTANWNTFIYASENHDVNATLTKIWGKHEISAGAEFMKRFLNVGQRQRLPAPMSSIPPHGSVHGLRHRRQRLCVVPDGDGMTPGNESYNFTKDLFVAEGSPYYALPRRYLSCQLRTYDYGGTPLGYLRRQDERHNRLEYFDPNAANTVSGVSYTARGVCYRRRPHALQRQPYRLWSAPGRLLQPAKRVVVRGGAGFYFGPSTQWLAAPHLTATVSPR